MAEVTARNIQAAAEGAADAAIAAKLRSLSRPGFDPKGFARTIQPVEIAAVAGLVLLALATIFVYSYWILPDQVSQSQASARVEANRKQIEELQAKLEDPAAFRTEFERAQQSLETFRGEWLKPRLAGRLEIIDAVDRISRETGVRLTSGVSFETVLASAAAQAPEGRERRREEAALRSFPSLGLSFSIEGSYPQVRNFISRFEASRQFVVIDTVSIGSGDQRDEEEGFARGPVGGPGSETVGLTISMTAYFQPEAAPAAQ